MALNFKLFRHMRYRYNVNAIILYNQILRPAPNVRYIGLSKSDCSKKNLLRLREERNGFIHDVFPLGSASEIAEWLKSGSRTIYAGFDPTADSLHIGNLLVIIAMLHAQRAGHKVIALVGGATAKIGDPSGKTNERPSLNDKIINKNVLGITENLERIFYNHQELFASENKIHLSPTDIIPVNIVNNNTWYNGMNIIDFLRTAGRKFRMGKLLSRDSVTTRLSTGDTKDGGKPDPDGGLSFTEFTYQVFQAYDWFHLHHKHKCSIQLGGSDQMGNIATGHEFITKFEASPDKWTLLGDRTYDHSRNECAASSNIPAYGILLPLVTSESGEKFGKSAQGQSQIWLSEKKTTPYDFYQFFMRLPDTQIEKMLYFFTLLPPTEIKDLMNLHQRESEKRYPHKKLAEFLTRLVHGSNGLNLAEKTTEILFGSGVSEAEMCSKLANLNQSEMSTIFSQAKYVRLMYTPGISIIDLSLKIGCFKTEKDAQRIISAGGFHINQVKRTNVDELLIFGAHILPNNLTLLRVGKRNYFLVEWTM